jgi:hypothetical protein
LEQVEQDCYSLVNQEQSGIHILISGLYSNRWRRWRFFRFYLELMVDLEVEDFRRSLLWSGGTTPPGKSTTREIRFWI